jgi:hypothetical protein
VREIAVIGITVGMTVFVPGLFVGMWALNAGKRRVVMVADAVIHIGGGIVVTSALLLIWSAVL